MKEINYIFCRQRRISIHCCHYFDMLPNLDGGECVVAGDAIMLSSKIVPDKNQRVQLLILEPVV